MSLHSTKLAAHLSRNLDLHASERAPREGCRDLPLFCFHVRRDGRRHRFVSKQHKVTLPVLRHLVMVQPLPRGRLGRNASFPTNKETHALPETFKELKNAFHLARITCDAHTCLPQHKLNHSKKKKHHTMQGSDRLSTPLVTRYTFESTSAPPKFCSSASFPTGCQPSP